jgi:hypothetical protein
VYDVLPCNFVVCSNAILLVKKGFWRHSAAKTPAADVSTKALNLLAYCIVFVLWNAELLIGIHQHLCFNLNQKPPVKQCQLESDWLLHREIRHAH